MTTEELKRRMYNALAAVKMCIAGDRVPHMSLPTFEDRMEAYLDEVRKDLDFACKSIDVTDAKLRKTSEERDDLRNRLQAFEFANKSAGEFLREARLKILTQRQSIGQLKNERDNATYALKVKDSKLEKALHELSELRKVVGSTSAQSYTETVSIAATRSTIDIDCRHEPDRCDHQLIGRMIFNNHTQRACLACGEEMHRIGEVK